MNGTDLLDELKRQLGLTSNRDLARKLGMSEVALGGWRRKKSDLSPRQIANLVRSAIKAELKAQQHRTVRPIAEFFPLDAVQSRGGTRFELFAAGKHDNPLKVGLREILKNARGIYIFYDSRGQAIYAGKAKRLSLWNEMKSAFNRPRDTQTVFRVRHPTRRQQFVPAYEKPRQPRRMQLRLNELAAYFTAYEVETGMIDELEALLVRGFANDLLNERMERFAGLRARRAGTKR